MYPAVHSEENNNQATTQFLLKFFWKYKLADEQTHTVHSCISCSLVASRMTKMFSLRADSCCCCFSFSSDSFSPVTSFARMDEKKCPGIRRKILSKAVTHSPLHPPHGFHIILVMFKQEHKASFTYNLDLHILPPGPGHTLHVVSTYGERNICMHYWVNPNFPTTFPPFQMWICWPTWHTTPLLSGSSCQIHWGEPESKAKPTNGHFMAPIFRL